MFSVQSGTPGIKFGAVADAAQVQRIRQLASRLPNGGPVDDELCFQQQVSGWGSFDRVVAEVKQDGEILKDKLKARHDAGHLPAKGTVDVHYLWRFSSGLLARMARAVIEEQVDKHPDKQYQQGTVHRIGSDILLHWRIDVEAIRKALGSNAGS